MKKMINELIRAWYGLRALLVLARLVALFPLLLLVDAGESLEWDPAPPETPHPALWRIYQWTPTGGLEWAAVRHHVAPWPLLPTATVHPPDEGASYIAQAEGLDGSLSDWSESNWCIVPAAQSEAVVELLTRGEWREAAAFRVRTDDQPHVRMSLRPFAPFRASARSPPSAPLATAAELAKVPRLGETFKHRNVDTSAEANVTIEAAD